MPAASALRIKLAGAEVNVSTNRECIGLKRLGRARRGRISMYAHIIEGTTETGFKEFERQATQNTVELLRDPERNIQIGCWYLEKLRENYRGAPAETAMTLAAYNAGPSRVGDWMKDKDQNKVSENEFVSSIGISTTRSYVSSILDRYRAGL